MRIFWIDFKKPFQGHYLILLLLAFFLLTGCGQTIKGENILSAESKWEVGQGKLNSTVGSKPNKVDQIPIYPDMLLFGDESIIDESEYSKPTGKWFLYNGEGKFGYGLTEGTMKPGEDYYVSLFGHNEDGDTLNRDVRIQLTERDYNLKKIELVEEYTFHVKDVKDGELKIFSNRLPNKENAIYFLSVEILDEQRNAEDTLVSMIYTPVQEINAELSLDKDVYKISDKEAKLTLENFGPTFLSLGTYYTIEKNVDEIWRIVPLELFFTDIGILLKPNNKYDDTVEIDQLTAGKYRIIKTFNGDGTELSETLAVEFEIE